MQDEPQIPNKILPRIVRIRRSKGQIVQGCDIFIGRQTRIGGWDLDESKWNNPFTLTKAGKKYSSETLIYKMTLLKVYETHIRSQPELMAEIPSLAGKTLGCFCDDKYFCHGNILIKLFKEL